MVVIMLRFAAYQQPVTKPTAMYSSHRSQFFEVLCNTFMGENAVFVSHISAISGWGSVISHQYQNGG